MCSNVVQVERSRVHTTKALTRSSNLFLIFGFYDFTFVHNTSSTAMSQISNASHMFLLLALFISFIFLILLRQKVVKLYFLECVCLSLACCFSFPPLCEHLCIALCAHCVWNTLLSTFVLSFQLLLLLVVFCNFSFPHSESHSD